MQMRQRNWMAVEQTPPWCPDALVPDVCIIKGALAQVGATSFKTNDQPRSSTSSSPERGGGRNSFLITRSLATLFVARTGASDAAAATARYLHSLGICYTPRAKAKHFPLLSRLLPARFALEGKDESLWQPTLLARLERRHPH